MQRENARIILIKHPHTHTHTLSPLLSYLFPFICLSIYIYSFVPFASVYLISAYALLRCSTHHHSHAHCHQSPSSWETSFGWLLFRCDPWAPPFRARSSRPPGQHLLLFAFVLSFACAEICAGVALLWTHIGPLITKKWVLLVKGTMQREEEEEAVAIAIEREQECVPLFIRGSLRE